MEVIETVAAIQERSAQWRAEGRKVVLVPTMGALHAGHMALIAEGRGRGDRLVASIFINPTQFGPSEDLEAYPRTFEADCEAARRAEVDAVFSPSEAEIYPEGYQTYITVERISRTLCGEHRPEHFRGVATVVLKLFNAVAPDVAVFGWKDAQQFLLLQRMVNDLHLSIEMIGVETVREADGLALSSRNRYLSASERAAAPAIRAGLIGLRDRFEAGEFEAAPLLSAARGPIEAEPELKIQYLEMVSRETFKPLDRAQRDNTLVAAAVHAGSTRLIDNIRL